MFPCWPRQARTAHHGALYVYPRAHAVVLSVDEKSQFQPLERTQPGLPLKKGRCGTMTHDCIRNGTITLFVALNVLEGGVIGRCMQRHRHQEFIRFLNAIEAQVPAASWRMSSSITMPPPTLFQRLCRRNLEAPPPTSTPSS